MHGFHTCIIKSQNKVIMRNTTPPRHHLSMHQYVVYRLSMNAQTKAEKSKSFAHQGTQKLRTLQHVLLIPAEKVRREPQPNDREKCENQMRQRGIPDQREQQNHSLLCRRKKKRAGNLNSDIKVRDENAEQQATTYIIMSRQ